LIQQEDVNADSVKIEETVVDVSKITSFPYTVYIPITVTKEGLFNFKLVNCSKRLVDFNITEEGLFNLRVKCI
jgi:hypothetical protein